MVCRIKLHTSVMLHHLCISFVDGFRWVEVTGATLTLNVSATVCYPLRSDVAQSSLFASSNGLLNRVHAMSVNTEECNMMSIQSDCESSDASSSFPSLRTLFVCFLS